MKPASVLTRPLLPVRPLWSRLGLYGVAAVAALAALWLGRQRFGWGAGDLTPSVEGDMPSDTPLPEAVLSAAGPQRSSWHTLAVPGSRAARRYLLVQPTEEPSRPRPLVVVLHGDGGTAESFHRSWPFHEISGSFAWVVYGDGLRATWDTESAQGNPDVGYLDALIDDVAARVPLASPQVFLTGYSSGGFLAQLYACQRSPRVRAISTHEAGAPYNQAERWPNGSTKCPGQGQVATLVTHGRDDFAVGFKSGLYSAFYWAEIDGCASRAARPTGYAQCVAYTDCAPRSPVVFCDIPGLGHWVWDRGAEATVSFFQNLQP